MSRSEEFRSAVAAGAMGAADSRGALLDSIVQVASSIFAARAASILLLDAASDELVFAAVAGEGERSLIGTRMSAGNGIAGWVLTSGQPVVIEDVARDPRFAHDVAKSTGYIPSGIMAAPLMREERTLGVLSVLDRPERSLFSLPEMELLGRFANQAAIALDLTEAAARARNVLAGEDPALRDLAALAESLGHSEGARAEAASLLIEALRQLLA